MHTTEEKEHINMKIDTPNLMRIVSFKWVSMMHVKRSIKEAYASEKKSYTNTQNIQISLNKQKRGGL